MKYAAFLRAINVSGKNKISMADLKKVLSANGINLLTTYLQSGNVVFEDSSEVKKEIENRFEKIIDDHFKLNVKVIAVSKNDVDEIMQNNEFLKQGLNIDFLHITLMKETIKLPENSVLNNRKDPNEKYFPFKNYIYLYCPNGYGKTKLNNGNLENWLKNTGTTRNWKTMEAVSKLIK